MNQLKSKTMKKVVLSVLAIATLALAAFSPIAGKLVSTKTSVKFFSTTPAEDIEANNYKTVSTIDSSTGDVVFSVPMQSFEFEKALMQKHFNSKDFLNTKKYPKGKFVGKITNLSDINFEKDGTYNASIAGELTIKDVAKQHNEKGTITVKGKSIEVKSKFNVTLADHGIAFTDGKPSTNVAKTIEVTIIAEYPIQ